MDNIRIAYIRKAENNCHYEAEMVLERDGKEKARCKYSFELFSCKPCLDSLIRIIDSIPVPLERFDDFCSDFKAESPRHPAILLKDKMRQAFAEIACG